MWDYRPRNIFTSKYEYIGLGYSYHSQVYRLTLQATHFNQIMESCEPTGKAFDLHLYRAISKKNIILTSVSFVMYSAGVVMLVNATNTPTEQVGLLVGGVGLTGFFIGSVRLIRKTNRQRQLFKNGINYFNSNCIGKTIYYEQ
jgi:hypothetical protein